MAATNNLEQVDWPFRSGIIFMSIYPQPRGGCSPHNSFAAGFVQIESFQQLGNVTDSGS